MSYKRLIQLELNELSIETIEKLIAEGELPNFAHIHRDWTYLKTTSEQKYENLEPWIQWVTVHTGKTFGEHGIFRLGDAHRLQHPQIWEVLSRHGLESAILGSMNATRGSTKGGIFFPDPWSIQNDTFPEKLKPLWQLISSRVQGHATSGIKPADLLNGLKVCLEFGLPASLYYKIGRQVIGQKVNPQTRWKLAALFDLFLAELFFRILPKTRFSFYTLFLNSVAHYQHHYWRNFNRLPFDPDIHYSDISPKHDPITYGYKMYDRILGKLLKRTRNTQDTLVIVLTGLSQVPYTGSEQQGGMNYYRLNDHHDFARKTGLGEEFQVFPLMSRDWQIKYNSESARQKAKEILADLYVNGEQLFSIKENTPGFIFVETQFTKGVRDDYFIMDGKGREIISFKDAFTNIAVKSGHHSGIGHLWASGGEFQVGKTIPLTSVYPISLDFLLNKELPIDI